MQRFLIAAAGKMSSSEPSNLFVLFLADVAKLPPLLRLLITVLQLGTQTPCTRLWALSNSPAGTQRFSTKINWRFALASIGSS
jgi:hypothetical protein